MECMTKCGGAEGSFGGPEYVSKLVILLESYDKMADVDIDPFGEHDKTDSHPDGENIPLPLVNPAG